MPQSISRNIFAQYTKDNAPCCCIQKASSSCWHVSGARCSLFYSAVPSRPLRCASSADCPMKSHQNTWLWTQHDAYGIITPDTDHRKYRKYPITSYVETGCIKLNERTLNGDE